ncbi:MAG: hypothetical protein ACE5IR_15365 [bacterium]
MEIQPDFRELLELFNAHKVEYMIKVVQLGVPPVRVDIMTSLTGVALENTFASCVEGQYGDIPVQYIGRNEFILNKRATGRKKDISDLDVLGEE